MSNFENTMFKIRCHIPKLTISGSNNNKSQDNFLSVFDCLSVWWGKRDQSTWAVFTEPMSYIVAKKHCLKPMFRKDKASALVPRTKMHREDWRTKRIPEGTERCANPDCGDKRITSGFE